MLDELRIHHVGNEGYCTERVSWGIRAQVDRYRSSPQKVSLVGLWHRGYSVPFWTRLAVELGLD